MRLDHLLSKEKSGAAAPARCGSSAGSARNLPGAPLVPGSLPLATISHLLPEAGDEFSVAASSGCRVSSRGALISGAPGGSPNLDKCIACDRGHLTERMCAIVQALYSYS